MADGYTAARVAKSGEVASARLLQDFCKAATAICTRLNARRGERRRGKYRQSYFKLLHAIIVLCM